MAESGGTDRDQLLHELQSLMSGAQQATDLQALKGIFYRVQTVGQENPADTTIQRAVSEIKNVVVARGKTLQSGGTGANPLVTGSGSNPVAVAPAALPTPPEMRTPTPPVPPPGATRPTMATANLGALRPKAPIAPPPPAFNWKTAVLAGAGIALLLMCLLIYVVRGNHSPEPEPKPNATGAVEVRTEPPGAMITINGKQKGRSNAKIELGAGQYDLQAVLDGYEPAARTFAISPGATLTLEMPMRAASSSLHLMADLEAGTAQLDKQSMTLQAGQATQDKLTPGAHTLKVAGRAGEATIQFTAPAGELPLISSIENVKNFLPIVISNVGGRAHIQSTGTTPVKVLLDGKPAGEAGAAGLDVHDVALGDHELTWGEGNDQKKLIVHFGPAPSLTANLKLDLNAGTLVVVAGEDKAKVLLNGKPYPILTNHGVLRIPSLNVQAYTVSVAKDGYQPVPEQRIEIKKGEESRVQFAMKALPQVAVLKLEGAGAGTLILLDKEPLGTVQTDGFFSKAGVAPGEHSIELHREGFVSKTYKRTFVTGQSVVLSGSDVLLEASLGTVKVAVTPPSAQVFYRKSDGGTLTAVNNGTALLPAGSYSIVGRAPGFSETSKTVTAVSGKTVSVELTLPAEKAVVTVVKPQPMGMNAFESPGAWKKDGDWLVAHGGGYLVTKPATTAGSLTFAAALLKSTAVLHTRPLQWVVHYVDGRNMVLYKVDKKNVTRVAIINGKNNETKHLHNLEDPTSFQMSIEVSPHTITQYVTVDGKKQVFDTYTNPDVDLTEGKFGFLVQGNDEVGLAHFQYTPQQ